MRVAILGAGAFGSALAKMLVERGHEIALWTRRDEEAQHIVTRRESRYLPGVHLDEAIVVTSDLAQTVAGRPVVLVVTPSHGVRETLTAAAPHLAADAVVVNASKGIEEDTLATMDRVCAEVLPPAHAARAAFLSGPTFAKELVAGLPAAIVVASRSVTSAELVQHEFATDCLRIYTSDDVTGIELGGALKNICAIGAGISDGLGFGHNTRAALITRGLSEITRLGVKLGANPLTFAGLAGLGDLVLTCTGDLSRNRQVGLELGRGRSLKEILGSMQHVAEGVKTTRAGHALAKKMGVEMPITEAIHSVLYDDVSPRDAVAGLMARDLKAERG